MNKINNNTTKSNNNKPSIIFDFDGLLVDTEIISYRIYKDILNNYGIGFNQKDYSEYYSGKTEKANVNNIINKYNLPLTVEEMLEKVLTKEKHLHSLGVDLKRGALELLNFLNQNHYKISIASSSTKNRAIKILKYNNIYTFFNVFVFAENIKNSKPDPEIFLKACELMKEKPGNCIVLEDSEAGIEAANNANIDVICIPDMKRPDDNHLSKTLKVFDSLLEVIDFLKRYS